MASTNGQSNGNGRTDFTVEPVESDLPNANEWQVRLLISVEAGNPREAVEGFIGQIVDFGLRNFMYRAVNKRTGEQFLVQDDEVWGESQFADLLARQAEEAERIARGEGT